MLGEQGFPFCATLTSQCPFAPDCVLRLQPADGFWVVQVHLGMSLWATGTKRPLASKNVIIPADLSLTAELLWMTSVETLRFDRSCVSGFPVHTKIEPNSSYF